MAANPRRSRPVRAGHPRAGDDLGRSAAPATDLYGEPIPYANVALSNAYRPHGYHPARLPFPAIPDAELLSRLVEYFQPEPLTDPVSERPAAPSQSSDSKPFPEPGA